jgi:hypothetical protein
VSLINRHHIKNSRRQAPRSCAFSLMISLLAIFIASLLAAIAHAAPQTQTATAPEEEARWFQVELILFAQIRGEPLESEQWPEIEGISLPDSMLELHLPPVKSTADQADKSASPDQPPKFIAEPEPFTDDIGEETPELPPAYQILGDDALQLTEMVDKLRRSSRFRPLLHIAWQQPTFDREHSQPIFFMQGMSDPLPDESVDDATAETESADNTPQLTPTLKDATEEDTKIGPPNPQFVGTVTLSVERYLHLATDLVYRQPVTQHKAVPISDLDLWYDRPFPTLQEPQGPAYRLESWLAERGFRLVESRRMRSTEIHYLDNPFMGLVVVITPVELPEPAEEIQQTSPQNILITPGKP